MKTIRNKKILSQFALAILMSMAINTPVFAAEESQADIAKELHNPLSNLREIIFQLDVLPDVGPDNKTDWAQTFQPVYPVALSNDWKLVTYSIIPVVSQPGVTAEDDRTNGLGDSTFFGYFVPPNEDGALIWGFGPALQAPTHSNDNLGNDQWAAGPALIVGSQPGNWSIWGLFDNVWSFAGSDDEDINDFSFQYQVVYLFPNIKDWFFISNWTAEADWEAPSGDKWTVPVGGGLGKQFKIGKHQFQAYGQLGYNVVKPDDYAATWRGIGVVVWVF
jgi:hypothetical protein